MPTPFEQAGEHLAGLTQRTRAVSRLLDFCKENRLYPRTERQENGYSVSLAPQGTWENTVLLGNMGYGEPALDALFDLANKSSGSTLALHGRSPDKRREISVPDLLSQP